MVHFERTLPRTQVTKTIPIICAKTYPSCCSKHKQQAKAARDNVHHAIKKLDAKASRPFIDRVHVRLRTDKVSLRQEQVRIRQEQVSLRPTREDADKCKAVKIR